MKKVLTVLFLTIGIGAFAQEAIDFKSKIELLNREISALENQKSGIEKEIDRLLKERNGLVAQQQKNKINSEGYLGIIKENKVPMFEDTISYSKVVKTLSIGDSVTVIGYRDNKLFIDYSGFFGYVHPLFLKEDSLITNFVALENEQADIRNNLKRMELEDSRKQAAESKRKAIQLRQQELAQDRIKKIKSVYPEEIAQKIISRKIWIGMTSKMAVLSIGSPEKINRTVTGNGTNEQWVYGSRYLYFDNGILTAYQD
jgi:hypothetical protein